MISCGKIVIVNVLHSYKTCLFFRQPFLEWFFRGFVHHRQKTQKKKHKMITEPYVIRHYSQLNAPQQQKMKFNWKHTPAGIDVFYSDFIFHIFSFPIPFFRPHSIFEYLIVINETYAVCIFIFTINNQICQRNSLWVIQTARIVMSNLWLWYITLFSFFLFARLHLFACMCLCVCVSSLHSKMKNRLLLFRYIRYTVIYL